MKHISLNGTIRENAGKAAVKAIRRAGLVPCNLYGNGVQNILFTVNAKELKTLTHTPNSYIVDINLSNGQQMTAVLHEAQWHPVTDEPLHMDFLAVCADKTVVIDVPVQVSGHSEGVKLGGKLYVAVRKIRVSALMDKLPDVVNVDVTPLQIGGQIVAGDINMEGVTVVSPKKMIICSVLATRASAQQEGAAE